jgi:hypothetical protein
VVAISVTSSTTALASSGNWSSIRYSASYIVWHMQGIQSHLHFFSTAALMFAPLSVVMVGYISFGLPLASAMLVRCVAIKSAVWGGGNGMMPLDLL